MTPADLAQFALGCLALLAVLSLLAALADWWDGRARRDSRRRNPYPQRTRDHARRIR